MLSLPWRHRLRDAAAELMASSGIVEGAMEGGEVRAGYGGGVAGERQGGERGRLGGGWRQRDVNRDGHAGSLPSFGAVKRGGGSGGGGSGAAFQRLPGVCAQRGTVGDGGVCERGGARGLERTGGGGAAPAGGLRIRRRAFARMGPRRDRVFGASAGAGGARDG